MHQNKVPLNRKQRRTRDAQQLKIYGSNRSRPHQMTKVHLAVAGIRGKQKIEALIERSIKRNRQPNFMKRTAVAVRQAILGGV